MEDGSTPPATEAQPGTGRGLGLWSFSSVIRRADFLLCAGWSSMAAAAARNEGCGAHGSRKASNLGGVFVCVFSVIKQITGEAHI